MNDVLDRTETMRRKFKDLGYRMTPQRLAILKILAESRNHPSAEEIFEQVKANFPTTSMATVYKTISVLKALGEVLELEFSSDFNRYDGNRPAPHPHLICTRCKRIVDPEIGDLMEVAQKFASATGFKITGHRMDFYGLCPECQERE